MSEAKPIPTNVSVEDLQRLVNSINAKFQSVDAKLEKSIFRFETLLKLLCQNGSVTHSSYVKGLHQFAAFSTKVDELNKIPKLSVRIAAALEYNESIASTPELVVLADDLNILRDVASAETISKKNLNLCKKLPSTDLFQELLAQYTAPSESQ